VDELQEENRQLRAHLAAPTGSSRTVSISGVNGEIIAEGHLDDECHLREDSVDYCQVDLTPGAIHCSSMEQFRIGDLRKSVLESPFTDHEYGASRTTTPIIVKQTSCSVLVELLSLDFDALPHEYDQAEVFGVFSALFNEEGGIAVTLLFESIQFANNTYTVWNVRPLVVNQEI
jgi:hypothetical protein